MNELELYDILTLSDDKEYTILRKTTFKEKDYYLLSEIDEEETPTLDKLKILEYQLPNKLLEITDDKLLQELGKIFTRDLEFNI